jgi:hypothetical protein
MRPPERAAREALFWSYANPLLEQAGVTRSTMMGFACLRLDGAFFASCDHRSGDLVVKLDRARVQELLTSGRAEPFAPNGRVFGEWAAVPVRLSRTWAGLLDDALQHAAKRRSSVRTSNRPDRR